MRIYARPSDIEKAAASREEGGAFFTFEVRLDRQDDYYTTTLVTADEVGDLQASESELVAGPLRQQVHGLADENVRLRSDNERLGLLIENLVVSATNLVEALKRTL